MVPRAICSSRTSLKSVTILGRDGRCVGASAIAAYSAVAREVVKIARVLREVPEKFHVIEGA